MKIRTRGNQAFNVPNTDEGRLFLKLLGRFRNRRWHYRARGRGPRKAYGGLAAHVPQKFSDWLAVYLRQSKKPADWDTVEVGVDLAAPVEDDAVDLTLEEQALLEEILCELHFSCETQRWEEKKQEVFDCLFVKLVD